MTKAAKYDDGNGEFEFEFETGNKMWINMDLIEYIDRCKQGGTLLHVPNYHEFNDSTGYFHAKETPEEILEMLKD